MKTLYDVLGVGPSATAREIKQAFRREIAKYHPDKVQHLGAELQEVAARRAAEITEAYRQLSGTESRDAYDQTLGRPAPVPAPPPDGSESPAPETGPSAGSNDAAPRFDQERTVRDDFVRKASLDRLRDVTETVLEEPEEVRGMGFEVAFLAPGKRSLLKRTTPLLICGRFVPQVDATAVRDAWSRAVRLGRISRELCIFLLGNDLAPLRELSGEIAELKQKLSRTASSSMRIVVVPVDVHDWNGPVPADTPSQARTILDRHAPPDRDAHDGTSPPMPTSKPWGGSMTVTSPQSPYPSL